MKAYIYRSQRRDDDDDDDDDGARGKVRHDGAKSLAAGGAGGAARRRRRRRAYVSRGWARCEGVHAHQYGVRGENTSRAVCAPKAAQVRCYYFIT